MPRCICFCPIGSPFSGVYCRVDSSDVRSFPRSQAFFWCVHVSRRRRMEKFPGYFSACWRNLGGRDNTETTPWSASLEETRTCRIVGTFMFYVCSFCLFVTLSLFCFALCVGCLLYLPSFVSFLVDHGIFPADAKTEEDTINPVKMSKPEFESQCL